MSQEAPRPDASASAVAESAGAATSGADAAFAEAMEQLLPMNPDQINEARKAIDRSRAATMKPLRPVVPISRSLDLTLQPGEKPPVIRTALGNVSTITFSDITGAPWPVLSVTSGNPNAYVAQSAGKDGETNIIVISPLVDYVPSNMVVTLLGHPVPVVISLGSSEKEADFRVDLRVGTRGPNAVQDVVGVGLPPTGDSIMLAFVDGVPPKGAERAKVSSSDVEAWRYEDMLYVRTRHDLLSPAYVARSGNVSGLKVFALVEAPILILSRGGRMETVSVER